MLYLKAWAYLQSPQNLWDFALSRKKEKTKAKGFAKCVAESNRLSAALLAIAEPVVINSSKKEIHLIEMKAKAMFTTFLSILIGLYIAFHFTLFSGMNPFLDKIFLAIIIALLVWNLVLIFREPNKKMKLIKLSILVLAIVIGLYRAKESFDSLTGENPRIYYETDTKLEN